jgi:transposase
MRSGRISVKSRPGIAYPDIGIDCRGGHLFFLPPYSPDLNPIEQVFAKIKHLLRAAQPRDVEATWRKVGDLLNLFSKDECANYFANSGYVAV